MPLRFLPEPEQLPARGQDPSRWRGLLYLAAATAAFATTQPWVRVRFERLFGEYDGPPGWQSSGGFTCLCTSMLVVVMAMAETSTPVTMRAVRPASLLLVAVATLALGLEWWDGPGYLRGVSAAWTIAFWLTIAGIPVLLVACALRLAASTPDAAGRYSSSGPPT